MIGDRVLYLRDFGASFSIEAYGRPSADGLLTLAFLKRYDYGKFDELVACAAALLLNGVKQDEENVEAAALASEFADRELRLELVAPDRVEIAVLHDDGYPDSHVDFGNRVYSELDLRSLRIAVRSALAQCRAFCWVRTELLDCLGFIDLYTPDKLRWDVVEWVEFQKSPEGHRAFIVWDVTESVRDLRELGVVERLQAFAERNWQDNECIVRSPRLAGKYLGIGWNRTSVVAYGVDKIKEIKVMPYWRDREVMDYLPCSDAASSVKRILDDIVVAAVERVAERSIAT